MWDLPGPGLEPVCPALAGGFLTTAPPGKLYTFLFHIKFHGNDNHLIKLVDCVHRNYVESLSSLVALQFLSWIGGT